MLTVVFISKAYILGAGCSRNYSQGITGVAGLSSPLDGDFFQMAKKVILARGGDYMFYSDLPLEHFLKDLGRMYGYEELPKEPIDLFDDPRLGLESVMTAFSLRREIFERPVYLMGFRAPFPSRNLDRLLTLRRLIVITIAEALKGPICGKHLKLAKSMKSGDIVLSFNYDILMENALRSVQKFTDNGYLITFYNVLSGGDWIAADSEKSTIPVVKLHGSLNWLKCSYCDSDLLARYQKVDEAAVTALDTMGCPKCNVGTANLARVIIPPLLTKGYDDPTIHYLWLEAERLLHDVEEVVIIGYSLPPTDIATETLLRTGFGSRIYKLPVTIVNTHNNMKQHFSRIFNPKMIRHIKNPDKYFQSLK